MKLRSLIDVLSAVQDNVSLYSGAQVRIFESSLVVYLPDPDAIVGPYSEFDISKAFPILTLSLPEVTLADVAAHVAGASDDEDDLDDEDDEDEKGATREERLEAMGFECPSAEQIRQNISDIVDHVQQVIQKLDAK